MEDFKVTADTIKFAKMVHDEAMRKRTRGKRILQTSLQAVFGIVGVISLLLMSGIFTLLN